jgi:hypothetical protein
MFSSEQAAYWAEQFDALCARRGLTAAEREISWEAVGHRCSMQVLKRQGPFYEAIQPFFAPSAAEDYRQGEQ